MAKQCLCLMKPDISDISAYVYEVIDFLYLFFSYVFLPPLFSLCMIIHHHTFCSICVVCDLHHGSVQNMVYKIACWVSSASCGLFNSSLKKTMA